MLLVFFTSTQNRQLSNSGYTNELAEERTELAKYRSCTAADRIAP
ncbi:hypothetical protein [Myxosarcina sp. GI1(2024)]